MLLALILAQALAAVVPDRPGGDGGVYNGRLEQLQVRPPRLEAELRVDGALDEPEWARAAILTGFSQFSPVDGRPAEDSTEVLVWYSPTAIYFGIRAFEPHGAVRATLADRDRIAADDHVQIFLGTFNDGRQAMVFAVNPLGVQSDGTITESGQAGGGGGFTATRSGAREAPDLSADFVFQSRGRVTDRGYEVEVRIPFKSIRFQPKAEQRWGIQVLRSVQHSGYEQTWTPAKRAAASFLAQSGTLEGLTDLRRGLVLDLNPVVTQRSAGARGTDGGWDYDAGAPELGGNVRWGVTNNLTLTGTVNPDFSQVEADAGQFSFDPRRAISFPEKRPFFLEGIEQFSTPNSLIYTRAIVQPVGAVKLTGKVSGTDVAFLSAVDERPRLLSGARADDYPVFNILRVQRDVGRSSRVALAYTDKMVGGDYNRVADVDGRLVLGRIYNAAFQGAVSRTRSGATTTTAPLWQGRLTRNGRTFGFRYAMTGIDPEFEAQSGFISRAGIANVNFAPRLTGYGRRGALVESYTGEISLDGNWDYDRFLRARGRQDEKLHLNVNAALRGGWSVGASSLIENFFYDSAFYAPYRIERPLPGGGADTIAFTGTPRLPNLDWVVRLATPQFKRFSGDLFYLWGRDENFFEWASADIIYATLNLNFRPTEQIRIGATYQHQQFDRRTDGSTVGVRKIPRVKMEYQITRAIFVRLVGEYDASRQDALRDDSRTGFPLLFCPAGLSSCSRLGAASRNTLRGDWLFSYQPNPGTVFFAGYSSLRTEPEALRFDRLRRTTDGFFVKASYLFRM